MLTGDSRSVKTLRRRFRSLPSDPRCKLCLAPYGGIGGFVLRPWFGPWERNPQLCKNCIGNLSKQGIGGAEIELSMLFADIRGSTGLGERLGPAAFAAVLNGFYRLATAAITDHDGLVDKFVGDETIGLFIPAFSGPDHAAKAIAAGRALLEAVTAPRAASQGPIPVGAGVHTGIAFVGSVGSAGDVTDFTALGDAVNTTARLASLAAGGELLVSADAARHAGLDTTSFEPRTVEVRGREASLEIFATTVASAAESIRRR